MKHTFTIFGSTGDLTYRKLMPALYNMSVLQETKEEFLIVAVGRKNYTKEEYIETIRPWVMKHSRLAFDEEHFEAFAKTIDYFQMNLLEVDDYIALNNYYEQNNRRQHVFYLAVSPAFFGAIEEGLKLVSNVEESKVIIEKPFGENLEDSIHLYQRLKQRFQVENIFHIDHYLGKEMIQNIKTIRFANALFKENWNGKMIEHIQITAFEKEGINNRGSYYDQNGALKDMVQNHLLQIVSILTMEEQEDQHEAQLKILKKINPILEDDVVLGQYKGYLQEKDVDPHSTTETYAALKITIDDPVWENVPIYIRTGKKMNRREIEVVVQFKALENSPGNILLIKIQPTEGVYLQFNIKKPGSKNEIQTVKMDFCQSCFEINRINTPEAYERLLTAALKGEKEYFATWEEIETSSRLIEKLKKPQIQIYEPNHEGVQDSLVNWIQIH